MKRLLLTALFVFAGVFPALNAAQRDRVHGAPVPPDALVNLLVIKNADGKIVCSAFRGKRDGDSCIFTDALAYLSAGEVTVENLSGPRETVQKIFESNSGILLLECEEVSNALPLSIAGNSAVDCSKRFLCCGIQNSFFTALHTSITGVSREKFRLSTSLDPSFTGGALLSAGNEICGMLSVRELRSPDFLAAKKPVHLFLCEALRLDNLTRKDFHELDREKVRNDLALLTEARSLFDKLAMEKNAKPDMLVFLWRNAEFWVRLENHAWASSAVRNACMSIRKNLTYIPGRGNFREMLPELTVFARWNMLRKTLERRVLHAPKVRCCHCSGGKQFSETANPEQNSHAVAMHSIITEKRCPLCEGTGLVALFPDETVIDVPESLQMKFGAMIAPDAQPFAALRLGCSEADVRRIAPYYRFDRNLLFMHRTALGHAAYYRGSHLSPAAIGTKLEYAFGKLCAVTIFLPEMTVQEKARYHAGRDRDKTVTIQKVRSPLPPVLDRRGVPLLMPDKKGVFSYVRIHAELRFFTRLKEYFR